MDEYIKKSEAVDVIVKYPYDIAGKTATAIKMIEDLPSADVVPKSEFEISQYLLKDAWKRIEELDKLCGELQRKYDLAVAEREANVKGFTEDLAKAKTEVASEIFAEIELVCVDDLGEFDFYRYHNLRKKYTEGKQ